MLVPRQTLVGRWGQEVWLSHSSAFRTNRGRAESSSQVCTAVIVPVMISRCCGLTGLGLGQGASPPSFPDEPALLPRRTSHPCQPCTTLLGHPASLRLTPSSLQPAQLLGQGTQATFLALTLNFLCGLRRLLAFSEPYFLGYKMDTKGGIMVLRTLPKAGPQASSSTPGMN